MVRTQIYLTEDERLALQQLTRATGRSQSELIREAIDRLIEERSPTERLELLRAARGMWKDRDDLPDFQALREEWDRFPQ